MIHLKQVFASKDEAPATPTIAAIVLRESSAPGMLETLKEDGFNIDDSTTADGLVTLKQADYDEDKSVVIKMSDDVALVMSNVEKMFTSYPEGASFSDTLKAAGFYPSVGIATDTFVGTIQEIMHKGKSTKDVTKQMDTAIKAYGEYVMALTSALPAVAFKMETMTGETTSEAAKDDAADAGDTATADVEAVKEDADKEVVTDAASTDEQQVAEATKGDMEDEPADASKSETETPAVDAAADAPAVEAEKAEDAGNKAILDMLASMKTDMSEKFSTLTDSVDAVKASAEENANRIEQVEATAKSAEEAVKGTVLAGDTTVASESLGNMGRNMRHQKSDDIWGGTTLDNITG